MITYHANVKWLSPVTWSLYGLYFISISPFMLALYKQLIVQFYHLDDVQYVKDVKNRRIYEQKGGTWLYEQS